MGAALPTNVMRRVEGPYDITVDPVSGDDSPGNDGTVTPLKTLNALFQRLPEAINQGYPDDLATGHPELKTVRVLLKGGDHGMPDPDATGMPRSMDASNVFFYGELSAGTSFEINSWSLGNIRVHQPAGNPAWTVDEHVGKVLEAGIDYGPPWGVYTLHWFILSNDTHSLTLCLDWTGYADYYLPPGTIVSIKSLLTRWKGPGSARMTGNHTWWNGGFFLIEFNTETQPQYTPLISQDTGSLGFYTCLMRASPQPYPEGRTFASVSTAARMRLRTCLFIDHFSGIGLDGAKIEMVGCAALRCRRWVDGGGESFTLNVQGAFYAKDCEELFFIGGNGGTIGFHVYSAFYCPNTGTWILSLWFLNASYGVTFTVSGRYSELPDPTAVPQSFFSINDGTHLVVNEWTFEPSPYPYFMFLVGGYGRIPQVLFSLDDLRNKYGHYYDAGFGAIVEGG
jgi:hypothetical protein